LHLAAGFNYAIFDWRNEISAKGFFLDAEAVYQELRSQFEPSQIKPMGSCRSTFVVAHLKELHHNEGVEVVMMHTPPSLRAVVAHTMWPANRIGLLGLGSIERDGADFDTLRRYQSLRPGNAATCLIVSEGDKTIPVNEAAQLEAAVKKSGPCELIIEPKKDDKADPHFGEPLRNPEVLKKYLRFLGGQKEEALQRNAQDQKS
ncbi:MAG TPA: hypothetical protein VGM34_03840, partial [Chlamydiales bacterium]